MKRILMAASAAVALSAGTAHAQDSASVIEAVKAQAAEINAALEAQSLDYRLEQADILFDIGSGEESITVFFNDRGDKQLSVQFMENDTRRAWSGSDVNTIDWTLDGVDTTADVSVADQQNAIASAMGTWDGQSCSDLGLSGQLTGFDQGYVEAIFGIGGGFFLTGDIMFSGFLPGAFMGNNVLGVHYGFNFIDPATGEQSDLNGDGYADKAFGDIYFNDNFAWSVDGSAVDIETVALHEAGHGLSQDHFGKGFLTKKGELKFAPRAVMNATYSGIQRELKGTDKGGHCSLWGSWPNN